MMMKLYVAKIASNRTQALLQVLNLLEAMEIRLNIFDKKESWISLTKNLISCILGGNVLTVDDFKVLLRGEEEPCIVEAFVEGMAGDDSLRTGPQWF